MQIILSNGYYIDTDGLNYTLKQKYKGHTKDGQEREAERICGYYGNMESALKGFVRSNQIDLAGDLRLSIDEYINFIEEVNKAAVQAIQSVLEGVENNGD